MSSQLKSFNHHTTTLPERAFPPHDGFSRGAENILPLEKNGQYSLTLPQENGGQTFTGKGKAGIIRSLPYYYKTTGCWVSDYLILNAFQNQGDTCRLLKRTPQNQYPEESSLDLTTDFIKAAGWELPEGAVPRVYALASLDGRYFIIQGYATDSMGKQIAWKTLLFNADQGSFTDSLFPFNDSHVNLFTPYVTKEKDK